jgi:hypothetical protein
LLYLPILKLDRYLLRSSFFAFPYDELRLIKGDETMGRCNCPPGPPGPPGPAGGVLAFADFYALMPPDNADTVGGGENVDFPRNGPTSMTTITRLSDSTFNLADVGTYQVLFQVSVDEAGQLIVALDGVELPDTRVGRATGTTQIVGMALVQTTSPNSILSIRNPTGNSPALTITPSAGQEGRGAAAAVSAHLVIMQIA